MKSLSLLLILILCSFNIRAQEDPGKDMIPAGMVLVTGGHFLMGSNHNANSLAYPAHPVQVAAFYMDVKEVSNSQYMIFCEATGHKYPEFWGMDIYRSGPDYPDHPVLGVSQFDATEYAEWAGKRLPTEAEWEYAARGGLEGISFPYGEEADRTLARINDPHADKGPVRCGSYPPNGFGLFDMSGNVWEWTQDWFDSNYYNASPSENPEGPAKGVFKVLRGGGWHSGPGCTTVFHRNALPMHWVDMAGGFRCVKDVSATVSEQ